MTEERKQLDWRAWIRDAVADVRSHGSSLFRVAWPWYGLSAVLLFELWFVFGVNPFALGGEEDGGVAATLLIEILLALCGAAVAVRMTRMLVLGEPLVVRLRSYLGLTFRYALRLLLLFTLAGAITAGATLLVGGIAGIKALVIPQGTLLYLLKQAVVISVVPLVFSFVFGTTHLYLTAAALERRDVGFRGSWELGRRYWLPLMTGMLVLYVPALAIDLGLNRLVATQGAGVLAILAYLIEAVVSVVFTAAQAAYFARAFMALVPKPVTPAEEAGEPAAQPA